MLDMSLIIRELNDKDESAFFEGMKEWVGEEPYWYTFLWKEGMPYSEMLERLRKDADGVDLPEGRVPHTMFYGFVDGKIIGRISVRHELNENLRRRGGHIGYAVAKRFRKNGYATEMVQFAKQFCKSLGHDKIMVTCADDNIPSWKIIEKSGGLLEDKIWDEEDEEMIRRYWIPL